MRYLFLIFAFILSASTAFAQKGTIIQVQPKNVQPKNVQPKKQYVQPNYRSQIQNNYFAQQSFHPIQPNYFAQQNNFVRPINNYYIGGSQYRGRNYNNWSNHCYFPAYRCYGFYCGTNLFWYYWYAPQNCFLPIYYIQTMPPVAIVNPPLPPANVQVQQLILPEPVPVVEFQETEITVTVHPDRIRNACDLNQVLFNKSSQFKMMSIAKLDFNTYRVVLRTKLAERELCGEVCRLPGVVYAER